MADFTRIYLSLAPWVGFSPILIAIAATLMTLRLAHHRWIAHGLTFVALVATLPLYIWLQGIVDPTTIQYSGPGDGFVVLLYLFCLGPAIVAYSGYAWLTRCRVRDVQLQSQTQG